MEHPHFSPFIHFNRIVVDFPLKNQPFWGTSIFGNWKTPVSCLIIPLIPVKLGISHYIPLYIFINGVYGKPHITIPFSKRISWNPITIYYLYLPIVIGLINHSCWSYKPPNDDTFFPIPHAQLPIPARAPSPWRPTRRRARPSCAASPWRRCGAGRPPEPGHRGLPALGEHWGVHSPNTYLIMYVYIYIYVHMYVYICVYIYIYIIYLSMYRLSTIDLYKVDNDISNHNHPLIHIYIYRYLYLLFSFIHLSVYLSIHVFVCLFIHSRKLYIFDWVPTSKNINIFTRWPRYSGLG